MTDNPTPSLALPTCPLWVIRACAVILCSAVLCVAPAPASGGEHHLFNPHARIDRSQIEVRAHG